MCNYLTADTKMREFDGCELTHLLYQSGKEKARFASIKGGFRVRVLLHQLV